MKNPQKNVIGTTGFVIKSQI